MRRRCKRLAETVRALHKSFHMAYLKCATLRLAERNTFPETVAQMKQAVIVGMRKAELRYVSALLRRVATSFLTCAKLVFKGQGDAFRCSPAL